MQNIANSRHSCLEGADSPACGRPFSWAAVHPDRWGWSQRQDCLRAHCRRGRDRLPGRRRETRRCRHGGGCQAAEGEACCRWTCCRPYLRRAESDLPTGEAAERPQSNQTVKQGPPGPDLRFRVLREAKTASGDVDASTVERGRATRRRQGVRAAAVSSVNGSRRGLGAPVGDACCGRCGRRRRMGATQWARCACAAPIRGQGRDGQNVRKIQCRALRGRRAV